MTSVPVNTGKRSVRCTVLECELYTSEYGKLNFNRDFSRMQVDVKITVLKFTALVFLFPMIPRQAIHKPDLQFFHERKIGKSMSWKVCQDFNLLVNLFEINQHKRLATSPWHFVSFWRQTTDTSKQRRICARFVHLNGNFVAVLLP